MGIPVEVRVALTSLEYLRGLLDTSEDATDRCWVLWQAEMLEYWAQLLRTQQPDFPAVAEALIDFAGSIQAHEHLGP